MPETLLGIELEGGQSWTQAQTRYFLNHIPGCEVPRLTDTQERCCKTSVVPTVGMQSGTLSASPGEPGSLLKQGCGSQEITALQQATLKSEEQNGSTKQGRVAAACGPQTPWTTLCSWAHVPGPCGSRDALSGGAAGGLDRLSQWGRRVYFPYRSLHCPTGSSDYCQWRQSSALCDYWRETAQDQLALSFSSSASSEV